MNILYIAAIIVTSTGFGWLLSDWMWRKRIWATKEKLKDKAQTVPIIVPASTAWKCIKRERAYAENLAYEDMCSELGIHIKP